VAIVTHTVSHRRAAETAALEPFGVERHTQPTASKNLARLQLAPGKRYGPRRADAIQVSEIFAIRAELLRA
jgi:hypothetical protein